MKNLKYLTLAIALNTSVFTVANANETADMGLSLASTIDALLQQNLADLQPSTAIEASQLSVASQTATQALQKLVVEIEETSTANNNTAKLTE
ncbi:hypothetical protein Q4574_19820 [Aliiglaciecola sp. 3_MG-2023]|uniref:hypothetical protein n=1 Tax=Aliiglaciecola sp. 3_MG-2023 TaxID=3062644 RepID=UPI0026E36D57|nr:hypothetical protein [Aliiglaciecola sp. 3_MG-2023]MDO6695558.1 hypothetical protein [Aliiglaciecola sp. 3_MG-2023]